MKKNRLYEKLGLAVFLLLGSIFYMWMVYFYITASFTIWNLEPLKMIVTSKSGLTGLIYIFTNNLMINIFGSFAYKVSSVLLFIGGTILLAGSAGLGFALSKDLFKKK